jgi:hypothetical protein
VARCLVEQIRKVPPGAQAFRPPRREDVEDHCRKEWKIIQSRFIESLDPDAVRQARAMGGLTPATYSYVMTVDADIRRNRAQAVRVFPLIRPVLMAPECRPVREAVDRGASLIDALAAHWKVPKSMVKTLHGIDLKDLGLLAGRLPVIFRLLAEIPASWWPRSADTWQSFAETVQTIQRVSKRPISSAANQLWLIDRARQGYAAEAHSPEDYVRMGEDIEEFMDLLRQALEHVAAALRQKPKTARLDPFQQMSALRIGLGLEKLAHTARRFADNYRRAVEAFAREAELWNGLRWPVIGRVEPRVHAGVLVIPLQSPEDLRLEGQRMQNCVASYVEDCLRGRCQIWSLRLTDGTPLSTLETRTRTDKDGLNTIRVAQHKGFANASPPPAARRALQELMLDLHTDKTALATYQTWRQSVLRRPLSERQRHAIMQPVLVALEETLKGKWSWHRLIAERPEIAVGNQPSA